MRCTSFLIYLYIFVILLQLINSATNCPSTKLSNEIFYEIFDYLDGFDIFRAFYGLNHRLQKLLINPLLSMKCQLSSQVEFNVHYQCFLESFKRQVISIEFNDSQAVDNFMRCFIFDSSFSRLRSLTFDSISINTLTILLFYIKSLPCLSLLSINLTYSSNDLGFIYQMIFHLPLKFLQIVIPYTRFSPIHVQNPTMVHFSSIERLFIHHECTVNQLMSILVHTPCLRHLDCFKLSGVGYSSNELNTVMKLRYLTRFGVGSVGLKFDDLENLLLLLCFRLKDLALTVRNEDTKYLDADRWKELISTKMPLLKNFYLRYYHVIGNFFMIDSYEKIINRFTSQFWVDQQWILHVLVKKNKLVYCVTPVRLIGDYQDDLYTQVLQQLHVVSRTSVHPIFQMLYITYVNMNCGDMNVSLMINMLNILPHLKSMEISDSLLCEPMSLEEEDHMMLVNYLAKNKIMKISLRNVHDEKQIDFIWKHFPRIQYFRLDRVRQANLQPMIHDLILKANQNKILYQMTLCIICDDADYYQLGKLHQMIMKKKFLKNCIVHRRYARFYIEWI
ncbi:unnamed protein product [Adineta ricciae]|uniref:F-box domain-containing protein n=1 Tax=Adineta ricciae TaxID=249248 RepID=A0A815IMT5_ADIRI|nr:unnamed protein product [Adineta ricciae]CAF1514280.1 unnamed protein product [Adineta ricciae]